MTLKGQLQHFGLVELFQTLALNQHTGTLVVEHGDERKSIHFATGSISFVSSRQTVRIGEILVRLGKVTEQDVQEALGEQQESGRLVGRVLIDRGLVTLEDVQFALQKKMEEELYDLFLWERGTFEFLSGFCPPELMDPLQRHTRISIDPQSVLMEGLRQLDELRLIKATLPDFRLAIGRTGKPPGDVLEGSPQGPAIWELTAAPETVQRLLASSPEGRFQTLRVLHQLVEAGSLRALTYDEYTALRDTLRKQRRDGDLQDLYQALLETSREAEDDADFLCEAGLHALDRGDREVGQALLLQGMARYQAAQADARAWEVGWGLLRRSDASAALLLSLWHLRVHGNNKQVRSIRSSLIDRLAAEHRHADLEEFLLELEPELGQESSYWARRAENCKDLKRAGEAVAHLERAAGLLSDRRNLQELIRIQRLIYDLDPRDDVRRRIQSLLALEEQREAQKRRRFTWVGGALIVVLAASVLPVRHELRARELFERARLLEVTATENGRFEDSIKAYRLVADSYPMSSRARIAEERMVALRRQASEQVRATEVERAAEKATARATLEARGAAVRALTEQARQAEATGEYVEARQLLGQLLAEHGPWIDAAKVRFPLLVESEPPGAAVLVDGAEVGRTPHLLHYSPGARHAIEVRLTGRAPARVAFEDDGRAHIRVELPRTPLLSRLLPAPLGQLPWLSGGLLVLSCRDGWVYCHDGSMLESSEPLWRRQIGLVGHPAPWFVPLDNGVLCASVSGTVELLEVAHGNSYWAVQVATPLTCAPVVDPAHRWVAIGGEDGSVVTLDLADGRLRARSSGLLPVDALWFTDGQLHGTDRARGLFRIAMDGTRQALAELTAAPAGRLADGRVLLTDGSVPMSELVLPRPRTAIQGLGLVSFYGTDSAWVGLSGAQPRTGALTGQPTSPPLFEGELVFCGIEPHDLVCVRSANGDPQWRMTLEAPVVAILDGPGTTLLVFLANQRLLQVEGGAQ